MNYLHPYIPIALMLLFGAGFAIFSIVAGRYLGPIRPNPNKDLPYESGIVPTGEANVRIPIKFYMVALLFLLFDVEAVFLLAWAVIFRGRGLDFESGALAFTAQEFQRFAFLDMLVFILILLLGYVYVWRKGGLEWS